LKIENGKWKIKGEGYTPYLCWKLNNYFKFPREVTAKLNSKNIMLSWIKKNLLNIKIKHIKTLPKNTIFTSNRKINKLLKTKGKNAYYEISNI